MASYDGSRCERGEAHQRQGELGTRWRAVISGQVTAPGAGDVGERESRTITSTGVVVEEEDMREDQGGRGPGESVVLGAA
jgi:hypothetical protein